MNASDGPVTGFRAGRGTTPLTRLIVTHALSTAGDAFFAVGLAGSLFFAVSLDAARPQIILYLVLTMAPFALVAPFLGPFSDRFRGGHRRVLVLACAGRVAASWLLAGDLRSLLLYPEAFAVLVLGKSYSVSKSALVPELVDDDTGLVAANSRLTMVSLGSGAVAGGLGSALVALVGAPWALRMGALVYAGATLAAVRVRPSIDGAVRQAAVEYETLHAPLLRSGAWAVALLRGAVGFLLFLLAFALRRAGEPAWFYGLVFVASGVGAFLGSVAAPRMRRRLSETRMLAAALALPALFGLIGALRFGRVSVLLVPLAVGIAASAGRQAFDALVQRHAPGGTRGYAFARFETGFQLAWVTGALIPVVTRAGPRLGLGVLGGALTLVTIWFAIAGRAVLRLDEDLRLLRERVLEERVSGKEGDVVDDMLASARKAAADGSTARAVMVALAALDVAVGRAFPEDDLDGDPGRLVAPAATRVWVSGDDDRVHRWEELARLRREVVRGERPSTEEALTAVALAEDLVRAVTSRGGENRSR